MKVSEFQDLVARLYLERDRARGIELTAVWMVEEMGELAEAVRRRERAGVAEELADVVAWAASVANLAGVDLEAALAAKYPGRCARCGGAPCRCP
ncbi:MAG TPA: MazG nucleotide pyrophosphohydrolase domain-containing protein [Candidatus Thermoplasmatota archaeon]|nr:MazG nucleotide pyrophosphohydrolase domain-containing protein [Candidatus Thermoplasmatota archaeon]